MASGNVTDEVCDNWLANVGNIIKDYDSDNIFNTEESA